MNRSSSYPLLRLSSLALLTLLIPLAAGCGPRFGEVKGTVTYKNAPLKTGQVQFMGSDNITYVGYIQPDGTYSAKVIAGNAKVMVTCTDDEAMVEYNKALSAGARGNKGDGKPAPPAPKMPASGTFSLIPEKYSEFESSGLTITVNGGKNPYDIKLD